MVFSTQSNPRLHSKGGQGYITIEFNWGWELNRNQAMTTKNTALAVLIYSVCRLVKVL
jgi:hypothetical protein